MKKTILFYTYGTRGDVQPLLNLAITMKKLSSNLEAIICAPNCFKRLVEGSEIHFHSCEIESVEQPRRLFDPVKAIPFAQALKQFDEFYTPMANGMYNVAL